MVATKLGYRVRVFGRLQKLMQQRKSLLVWNRSRNGMVYDEVCLAQEAMLRVCTDVGMAHFVLKYRGLIRGLPPGNHLKVKEEVEKWIYEAEGMVWK